VEFFEREPAVAGSRRTEHVGCAVEAASRCRNEAVVGRRQDLVLFGYFGCEDSAVLLRESHQPACYLVVGQRGTLADVFGRRALGLGPRNDEGPRV
jgi:hypothetical protein